MSMAKQPMKSSGTTAISTTKYNKRVIWKCTLLPTMGQSAIQKAHPQPMRFVPEPTVKYNAGTHYNRLIERRCASLDLEAAFKQIKISQDIVKQVCKECNAEFCRCPAFTPGTPCTSASSTPTSISDEQIPSW